MARIVVSILGSQTQSNHEFNRAVRSHYHRALRAVIPVCIEPLPSGIRRPGSDPANVLYLGDERTPTARRLEGQNLAVHDAASGVPRRAAKPEPVRSRPFG